MLIIYSAIHVLKCTDIHIQAQSYFFVIMVLLWNGYIFIYCVFTWIWSICYVGHHDLIAQIWPMLTVCIRSQRQLVCEGLYRSIVCWWFRQHMDVKFAGGTPVHRVSIVVYWRSLEILCHCLIYANTTKYPSLSHLGYHISVLSHRYHLS